MPIGFPGLTDPNRRTVRAPVNPLDKTTIVSIYPRRIKETKHTLQPGEFVIEPGSYEKPSLLVVGPSSWWREIDENQPLLEIPVSSIQIADSVVNDYCNGLLGCNMNDAMPGLFIIPGEHNIISIKKEYQKLLDKANEKQRKWFSELVRIADTLWARTNGNPLTIGDDMRLAAQELRLEDKPWLGDFTTMKMVNCIACGNMNNSNVIVCPNCKVVLDRKRFDELKLGFAS